MPGRFSANLRPPARLLDRHAGDLAATSGVYFSTTAVSSSKFSVRSAIKLWSCQLSEDDVHQPVDQGHVRARLVAHVQVRLVGDGYSPGSATISLAPRPWPRRTRVPIRGCGSLVLEPMMKIQSAFSVISPMELVIAPLPKDATSPATVEECQRRAQ